MSFEILESLPDLIVAPDQQALCRGPLSMFLDIARQYFLWSHPALWHLFIRAVEFWELREAKAAFEAILKPRGCLYVAPSGMRSNNYHAM